MKNMSVLLFLYSLGLFSLSGNAKERVLLSDSKAIEVELNTKSVRCSGIGYGYPELKVNIPQLDGWTIFDHSNINRGDIEGIPCMTAGACKFRGNDDGYYYVDDILAGKMRLEKIIVKRQIIEVKTLSNEDVGQVCIRTIKEILETEIKKGDGSSFITFSHYRAGFSQHFPASFCN